MAELKTMYPGVANSPETFLKEALTIDGTIMYLADGSVLGEIPTLAVIGEGQQAETVLVTSTRSDGGFAVERGVEGPKKAWTKATTVARNWTNKDYEALRTNITAIDTEVETKVDKVAGKDLSTHDYDDKAKAKVDAIPPDPKYTDTIISVVNDLTSGGTTKSLSAEQGKILADKIIIKDASSNNFNSNFTQGYYNGIFTTNTPGGAGRYTLAVLPTDPRTNYPINYQMQFAIKDNDIGSPYFRLRKGSNYTPWRTLSKNDYTDDDKTVVEQLKQHRNPDIQRLESQKLNKTDIVNDLTTGGAEKALSAEQGKVLEDTKLNKTDVINDLTTGGAEKALSAEQGKTLFTYADNGKKSIADAIVGKGVSATKSDDFSTLADKISKIKTGYSVGEEVSDENVEEIKTFHPYENESDIKAIRKKLEYSEFRGPVVECGEPSALVVDSLGRPFVATSSGEVLSYTKNLVRYYASYKGYPATAMSIRPNNELYLARESYSEIYRNGIGFFDSTDRLDADSWTVDVGAKPINAMASKHYYLYCGAGNKVVEVTNGFKKSWEFTEHTAQVNAVAVDNDWNVYSGGADNKVFKISPDGKKVWEFTLHTAAVNALAVDDEGYVYSGGADCTLYKISPDGKKVWENKTNNEITAIAIPPDGGVMVGTTGSTLYTFEFDGTPGESEEIIYGDESGNVVTDGDVVDIVVANDASIFMVTKKEKMIYKMKYGEYKTSYKIIK